MNEPMTQAEWDATHPACPHCGDHHGDFAARMVAQTGASVCAVLARARVQHDREKRLAKLGWWARMRARLGRSR